MAEIIDLTAEEPTKVIMLVFNEISDTEPHLHYKFLPEARITEQMQPFLEQIQGYTDFHDLTYEARVFFDAVPGDAADDAWIGHCRDECVIPEGCIIARVLNLRYSCVFFG